MRSKNAYIEDVSTRSRLDIDRVPAKIVLSGTWMSDRQMVETRLGALAVRVRGGGPVAVLWHSLFVDDRTWNRVEDDLARERRLVIITGPGHGASPDPGRWYNIDECAEAAADVLATLGIDEPVDWVGNAWGGHVGVVFAARWPERCRTLVTLGTPIQSYTLSERLRIWILLPVVRLFGPVGSIATGIREVLLSPTTRAQDPEAARLVVDPAARPDPLPNAIRHRQRPHRLDSGAGAGGRPPTS